MEHENAWMGYEQEQLEQVEALSEDYKDFLSKGKTERECVKLVEEAAGEKGFVSLWEKIEKGEGLRPGDKVYASFMNKAVLLAVIGRKPIKEGMNILGAHIDSPRLDLKQNPLYEDGGIALLDTHYYGGIKKYQWVTIPLAMHGVVAKKDGSVVEINIGDKQGDPVFCISDLLVHLSAEQLEKKARLVITGENLDVIVGNRPLAEEEEKPEDEKPQKEQAEDEKKRRAPKEGVKNHVLALLRQHYDISEEDFLSAELEIVPQGPARDCGLDRSMILAYGHDDRVCAYTSLRAILELENPEKTGLCILVDKEEIGSVGATGMHSHFFENTVAEIMNLAGEYTELNLRRALAASCMLSSDVSAAFDPGYASAFEKKNAAFLGCGLVFNKYTGARGKSGSNDASAEYMAAVRRVMEKGNVVFQTAELGRVDLGGGGTIAYIPAQYGMRVIDSGVALLNMHAPWEIASKADVYEAYKGYKAFLAYME